MTYKEKREDMLKLTDRDVRSVIRKYSKIFRSIDSVRTEKFVREISKMILPDIKL